MPAILARFAVSVGSGLRACEEFTAKPAEIAEILYGKQDLSLCVLGELGGYVHRLFSRTLGTVRFSFDVLS